MSASLMPRRWRMAARAGIAAAALAAAGAASAQSTSLAGPYLQFGAGTSSFNVDCTGVFGCDRNGTALQLIGGYGFANGWAIEGVYLGFGKSSLGPSELKATAVGLGGAWRLNFGGAWQLTVRAGLADVELKTSGGLNLADSSANPYVGAGIGYRLSPRTTAEAGLVRTRGEIRGDDGDVTALTVGLRLAF